MIVHTCFSTNDVHPRDRFEYWHEVACKLLVNHHSQPQNRSTFCAEIRTTTLSDIELVMFENAAMCVNHTLQHVQHGKTEELFVCRQIAGELALEQSGRNLLLKEGDMTLLDPMLPYAGRFSSESKLLVLKVPRNALEARVGRMRHVTARNIRPLHGDCGLASAFLGMLPQHVGGLSLAGEEIVKNQALDLIAVSLARTIHRQKPRLSSAKALALVNVHAAINSRLSDQALDGETVAAMAGISVRYANSVLAHDGTSLMRLIQTKRLERCRMALEDEAQAHRTISEIAYAWGFSDMTHFGRRFRATFGLLPSECRRRARPN
jgi:AraC family transcriptional regulator, positive regulator of tynA and feaB